MTTRAVRNTDGDISPVRHDCIHKSSPILHFCHLGAHLLYYDNFRHANPLRPARDTLLSLKRPKISSSEAEGSPVEQPERPSSQSLCTLLSTTNQFLASTTKRPLRLVWPQPRTKNSFTMMVLPLLNANKRRPFLPSWLDPPDPRLKPKHLVPILKWPSIHSVSPLIDSSFSSSPFSHFSP